MRRRDLLVTGAAMAGLLAARADRALGQGHQSRAAVVIGVDKAGGLVKLRAAASGARKMANWLQLEGYDLKSFTDDVGPVKAYDILQAVSEFVNRGTIEQLVIYFAGHGFLNAYTEYWMLSEAPNNPNEAISFAECVTLAYASAIPIVVFISDACRSTPSSLGADRVRGSLIFPSPDLILPTDTAVDEFFATHPGSAAYELALDESVTNYDGIYTATLLEAFQNPDSDMVQTVDGVSFISNSNLKEYLKREVPKRLLAISPNRQQVPDAHVESPDTVYIGRVAASPTMVSTREPVLKPTIADAAIRELDSVGFGAADPSDQEAKRLAEVTGFAAARNQIRRVSGPEQFESQSGCIVAGARVKVVVTSPDIRADLLQQGYASEPAIIRFWHPQAPGGSAAIRFEDDSGTIIAALSGYITQIVVDAGQVLSVSYVPSQNSPRWFDYQQERDRLEHLRSTVAAAARFGVFRIEGERTERMQRAEELADGIRILKGIDPALGLYAAYAYFEANLIEKVRSVEDFMRMDLNIDLFDVVMLAGTLAERQRERQRRGELAGAEDFVPFCPMLSQGWNLLRVNNVQLPAAVEEASYHLRPALWTTLEPWGMNIILTAMNRGLQ
jgi:hypothetical protein